MIHPPMSVLHAVYVQRISVSAATVNLFPVQRRIFGRRKRKSPYGIRFFLDPNPNQQGLHTWRLSRPFQLPGEYHWLESQSGPRQLVTMTRQGKGTFGLGFLSAFFIHLLRFLLPTIARRKSGFYNTSKALPSNRDTLYCTYVLWSICPLWIASLDFFNL